jgi:hypothetical protein
MILGSDFKQAGQIKSPSLPQPTHQRGNKRSSAIPLILVK